jgi:MarR family transcriptional repressor of emrRAB
MCWSAIVHAFEATERRVDTTCARFPTFPREPAVLVRLIKRIAGNVHDAGNISLREHGINHTDYNVLMMLYGSEEATISPSQLAAASGEKGANITRVCDALCAKGFLARARDVEDRRKVKLHLTARGHKLVESILPDMSHLLNVAVAGLDRKAQANLERLLKAVLVNTIEMESKV